MISLLPDGQMMEYSCDFSNPQIGALFAAACEAGTISVFLDGLLDNGAAEIENYSYPEEDLSGICGTPEQTEIENSSYPEEDLSGICGTPEQTEIENSSYPEEDLSAEQIEHQQVMALAEVIASIGTPEQTEIENSSYPEEYLRVEQFVHQQIMALAETIASIGRMDWENFD